MSKFYLWTTLLLGTLLEVWGDIYFKKQSFLIGMILYTLGTVFWALSLRFGDLSKLIIVFSVLNLTLAVVAGVYLFNEHLTWIQWVGVGLGSVSVILLSI